MEEKKQVTVRDLVEKVTGNRNHFISVAYNCSRTIQKGPDRVCDAYGLSAWGFICVFRNGHGHHQAYTYTVRHPMNYAQGSAHPIDPENALKYLQENKHKFYEHNVGEFDIVEMKQKDPWPELGRVVVRTKTSWGDETDRKYRVVRLKSGKLRAEDTGYWGTEHFQLGSMKNVFDKAKGIDNDPDNTKFEVISNTFTPEIMEEMKAQLVAEEI